MLEFVDTIKDLTKNVRQYQQAVHKSGRINPKLVRAWYYIPSLDMVGASRFIGYKDMTADRYDQSSEIDGRKTERHFREKGWLRQLKPREPYYARAKELAISLSKQSVVSPYARFYILIS